VRARERDSPLLCVSDAFVSSAFPSSLSRLLEREEARRVSLIREGRCEETLL